MTGAHRGGGRRPPFAAGGVLAVLLLAALLVGVPGLPAPGRGGATGTPAVRSAGERAPVHHPPALGIGPLGTAASARPFAGDEFYTQEGATIGQVNGTSARGVPQLLEYVRLRNSPYSTAYELNGLTNSGDWWQVTVGDNWPGCNAGFEELSEIWGVGEVSGPVTCSSNVTLASGDLVELTLNFQSGEGCLGLKDLTTASSYTYCESQPDSGGTKWAFLNTGANMDGYYTGPMTEVINLSAPSCPDNLYTPRMEYLYGNATHVTQYIPWSDEFDADTGTSCYTSQNGTQVISPGDPSSYYVNTAAGTGDGPHWVGGQNVSMVNATYGFRFETDANPMTSVTLSGSPTTLIAGASANFTLAVTGGSSPYQALWALDGTAEPICPTAWNWTASLAGSYAFVAWGVDTDDSVLGPSNTVTITVPGPLEVSSIRATPVGGLDVGGSVTFSVGISGGFGWYAIAWSGLPTGCDGANASSLVCAPSAAGWANVSVTVRDQNGSQVSAGPLTYAVYPTLSVGLTRSLPTLDVGETASVTAGVHGGSGGLDYAWSAPSSCSGTGPELNCTPVTTGPEYLSLTLTDSTGATALAGIALNVNPDLTLYVPAPRLRTDAGVEFAARVVVNGGTAPFGYDWSGLPSGCTSTGPVANCTDATSGTLALSVRVTDATGATGLSPTIGVIAADAPTVSVAVSAATTVTGNTVTFTANAQGGTAPYDYTWSGLPSGCAASNSATIACTPSSAGTYSVGVRTTDSVGANVSATTALSVTTGPSGPSGAGGLLGISELALILVGVAIAAAVVAGVVLARRRNR